MNIPGMVLGLWLPGKDDLIIGSVIYQTTTFKPQRNALEQETLVEPLEAVLEVT
jgi:hypothetical protein